jgi:hypothetical protein
MLNILYIGFIAAGLLWFLLAGRKEMPLLVITHSVLQYAFTLISWFFQLNPALSALLLVFLMLSGVLLIWARSLNYSKELISIRMFFSMLQWVVIFAVGVFILTKSPYHYMMPSANWQGHVPAHQLAVHPIIKICGNLLIFTTFFHLILNWGQRWQIRKSILDLLPMVIYLVALILIRVYQAMIFTHPIT